VKTERVRTKILLLLLVWISYGYSFSQEDARFSKNLWLRLDGHYGFVIPEYKHFNYIVNSPTCAFEASITKRTTGKSIWEQLYKYPEYGLTVQFTTLGNKDVLGQEIGIFPYVQSFLIRKEKFQFTNQFGLGFGYATKKFDLASNYDNISVGSHVNLHFNFKLGTRFVLGPKLIFNSGLSFTHFSNANMAEPNLGVNLFSAFAGFNYAVGQQEEFKQSELEKHSPKNEFAFIYAAGGKHTRALQSTVYFTSSISAEYKYHWKRKLHVGAGLDLFYDSSTKTEMGGANSTNYQSNYDFRSGIHLSQELVYSKFSFILQEGIYLGLTDHVDHSTIYNRAILRWKFNDHFLMSISMKSHLHILDYPELGFGYFFIKKK
jgi:hypothetical protein